MIFAHYTIAYNTMICTPISETGDLFAAPDSSPSASEGWFGGLRPKKLKKGRGYAAESLIVPRLNQAFLSLIGLPQVTRSDSSPCLLYL